MHNTIQKPSPSPGRQQWAATLAAAATAAALPVTSQAAPVGDLDLQAATSEGNIYLDELHINAYAYPSRSASDLKSANPSYANVHGYQGYWVVPPETKGGPGGISGSSYVGTDLDGWGGIEIGSGALTNPGFVGVGTWIGSDSYRPNRQGVTYGDVWWSPTGDLGTYSRTNKDHGYLGFSFEDLSGVHYGWLQVTVEVVGTDQPGYQVTLHGYGYETEVNKAIRTGDAGQMAVPEPSALALAAAGVLALGTSRRRRKANT